MPRLCRLPTVLAATTLLACSSSMKVYRVDRVDFPNKSGRLKNGLRVVVQPDESQPHVRVLVRYGVGAAYDPKEKKGIAHLVEHLAFRLGDELVEIEEPAPHRASSAEGGKEKVTKKETNYKTIHYVVSENAYTTFDETVYWKRVAPPQLGDVLRDFADQMDDFTPQISEEVFEAEREVVQNERRSRYESKPLDRVWLDLYDRMLPAKHPYQGDAVIGSHETISRIELSDVSAYLRAHYHPSNATLVIVGPVDPNETLSMVMEYFGSKPKRQPSVLEVPDWTPAFREATVVVPEANETMLTVAWPLGPRDSKEATAAHLLDSAIGGWFWGRLVTNREYAYWVRSFVSDNDVESLFVVQALLRNHGDLGAAKSKILEIAGLLGSELRPESLARAKRRSTYTGLYDAEQSLDRADKMAELFARYGHPMSWVREFEQVCSLTFSEAVSAGRRTLDPDRALVLVHTPETPENRDRGKAPTGAQPSYSEADAAKATGGLDHENRDTLPHRYAFTQPFDTYAAWATRAAERWNHVEDLTLRNGMRVRLVQRGSLPIMFVHARIPGGTIVEPADRHGVAEVMLGSMGLSGRAYRERRYRIGMHWRWETNPEFLAYGIKFLSVYADQGLMLAAEVLSSPRFSRRTVNNTRDQLVQKIADADRDVDALAYRALLEARGLERVEPIETALSLHAVDRGAVADFHDALFYPENVILTITSDRPVSEIEPLVRRHFGGWSASGKPATDIGAISPKGVAAGGGKIVVVPVDGTSQSKILVGFDAPGWRDWQGAVASQAVSELLQTKLRRLRAAMGVTYGADVWTRALRNVGSLNLSTKVDRNATDSAIEQLLRIVDDLRREPVTEGELDFVRRRLISDYIGRGTANSAIASAHGDLMLKGRQTDYFGKVVAYLKRLDLADLQAAVDARLGQPGTLVVVGQAPELHSRRGGPLGRFSGEPVRYTPAELLD